MRLGIGILLLWTAGMGCRSGKSVVEEGAVLLHLKCTTSDLQPDELRAWVYDPKGVLWNGARVPTDGPLTAACPNLGTLLIQPGVLQGALRVHVRAFGNGARLLEGALTIPSLTGDMRTFELLLSPENLKDDDGDGVPDVIDDCPRAPNATQNGCPPISPLDAGMDSLPAETDLLPPILDGQGMGPRDMQDSLGKDTGSNFDLREDTPAIRGDSHTEIGPAWDVQMDIQVPMDASSDSLMEVGSETKVDSPADAESLDVPIIPACEIAKECNKAQGASCNTNAECASGACADGVCCTNACTGACRSCNQPTATGVCQGYAVDTDPERECLSGTTCNGVGACGPQTLPSKENGQICNAANQCLSGFCADGVCCDTACVSPCQACGTGACLPVKRTDDFPQCAGTKTCNGKGLCVDP